MQCFEMMHRAPSTDTVTLTDAQEEVEQMLSTYLLNGFCLLEKACPACNVPLVKRPATNMMEPLHSISIQGIDAAIPPLAGIAYCVKCHAHVVANTEEFQMVQEHNSSSHKTGSIYFLSESTTMTDSLAGETTSKETGTIESTVVTRSAGSASTSSSNDYDDSFMSMSYQIEEIEVVLAKTEDEDVEDDDEIAKEEIKQQSIANDYPSPPPTQRMSNIDPINTKETKIEAEVTNTPRQCVELTLNEHETLLQRYRQNAGHPRHDPNMRIVDLDEIELKGGGEDVSLLAIDEMVLENRFFREIERTTSHETAVDLAIQQSTSRIRTQQVAPVLLDFPMPEFNVRREIAIKVLAGKMVQGYSIMDGQCDACLMPLMCDANSTVTPCFVCRSIRKSYYKSLATQAVETQCLKSDSELLRQKRLELQQAVMSEAPDPSSVSGARENTREPNPVTLRSDDQLINNNNDPTVSTFSFGKDDTVTNGSYSLPENHLNAENQRSDIATEAMKDDNMLDLIPSNHTNTPDPAPSAEDVSLTELKEVVNHNADVEPLHSTSVIDGNSDLQSDCHSTTQTEEMVIGTAKTEKEHVQVADENNAQASLLENEELYEASVAVSHCDSSIDVVRKEIGNRIQHGWTMLDKTCPECTLPLMTDETFLHEICIQCEMVSATMNNDNIDPVPMDPELHIEKGSIKEAPKGLTETNDALDPSIDDNKEVVEDYAIFTQEHVNDFINDQSITEKKDLTEVVEPEYSDTEMKSVESHVSEVPTSELIPQPMFVGRNDVEESTNQKDVEYLKTCDSVILLDAEEEHTNMTANYGTEKADIDKEPKARTEEHFDRDNVPSPTNSNSTEPIIVHDITNQADDDDVLENTQEISPDDVSEPAIQDCMAAMKETVLVVEDIECTSDIKSSELEIDEGITDAAKCAVVATVTEAIDAEKIFLEIAESKSHDQPSKPAIVGPFHWISSKTTGSSTEKSVKPLDPPASNDLVITDIFSRNCRRLGPPVGSRFRSNKSPEGFHRVDVRSCSPVRTLSPGIQQIESVDAINDGPDVGALLAQTSKDIETSTFLDIASPRDAKQLDDDNAESDDNGRPDDAIFLNTSPSVEIAQNFVRLEVPKTLSYTDRDAIVRLIEVATRTSVADTKNDALSKRIGRRAESPGNSVANMPHTFSSARSYTNSVRSVSTRSHSSKMSNHNNPPSPERHSVIDCTSPSNSNAAPKRAPSPGLSEAPNHRTISDTSSVYSNVSSRVSRNSKPNSEYSAFTGHRSEKSSQHARRRATPETTIRPNKPGLPSYIPGNPNRPYVLGSRSYQQTFPSESTAFSRTNSKNQLYPTSNQSTGSVKSLPVSNKTTFHHQGNYHNNPTLPSSTSWRERRDEIILIDDHVADERNSDIVDGDKLDALLARIESTKSQLENADDAISQYRMRDLIVNLTRSAELLQKIEES